MAFDVARARNDGYSDEEIAQYLSSEQKFDYQKAISDGYSATEIADYLAQQGAAPKRTVLGQVGETLKAVPRGIANTILSTGEGLAELADAATNVVGLEDLIDSGDENALVSASRAGRDWVANSVLGADPTYQDAWFTKFGEGVGSMATFLAPVGVLRGLGVAGKAIPRLGTSARELAVTGALATGAGAGDQAQRIAAARAQGLEVTQGQEDSAIAFGGLIGLSEIAPIASILKRVPKNISSADKNRLLDLLQKSIRGGAEEAVQESAAGLLQDFTEKGIYNPDLEVGQSFWDDLTVGGAVGAFADFVVNAAAGRRSYITTEAQKEFERKQREAEQKEIDRIRQAILDAETSRANRQADPEGFNRAAAQAQAAAAGIAPPSVEGNAFERAKAYGDSIVDQLGDFFPSNTKFTVERGPLRDVTRTVTNAQGQQVEVVEKEPSFTVKDSAGNQYGGTLSSDEEASSLAFVLNNAIINQQIRGQVLSTLETSGQSYDPTNIDTLTRYGFQILNPNKNLITSAAINEAAGTTADKGFAETVSFQTILDGNKTKDGYVIAGPNQQPVTVPGLTAAQQINQKRKEKGLPETQTFTVDEAREALGDKFENLTNINVAAIPDNMTYTATIVDGKPVVVSEANEVFTSRFASAEDSEASGKKEDGTPNIAVGQKIELRSLEDAQAFANRKNREAARGQGLSTNEINALFKSEKTLNEELTRLLEAKNISSKMDSPEIKTLFKSIVGKESLADMSFGEQRLLYARLRTLPRFASLTQLPVFEAKPYTRDNFVRASKFVQDANSLGQDITDDQIAQAAGLLPDDPRRDIKVTEIKKALNQQGVPTERPAKPVLLLPGPDGTTDTYNFLREEIRKKMKGFGLEDIASRIDQTLLNFGDPVRYMEEMGAETEGYYNPFLREITLAVDRIDPNKTLTPEQRVEALVDVLNHEIVHPARELDLWQQQEWDVLSRAAAKLRRLDANGNPTNQTFLQWAQQTYRDQGPLVVEEEAVADLSRQAKKFGDRAVSGKPKVLANRLFQFFDRLDSSLRGSGFQNYTDILDRLQSGQIGARTRGEIRTLRATEAALEKQGILPERFSDYQPIRITPQARNQEREEKRVQVQGQAQAAGVTDFNPNALEGAAIRESRSTIENVPAKIDVDGRQVPTRDSENRLIYSGYEGPEVYGIQTAPTQVGLKNFWNWFGKSKTVSRDGRPLVYYHGTAADITAFRPKQAGSVFITLNPRFAAEFSNLSENFMAGNFTDFLSDQQVLDVLNETLQSQSAFTPRTWDKVAKLRDSVANSVADNRPIRASVIKDLKEIAYDGSSIRFMNAIQTRMPSAANIVPVYVKAENPFDYQNEEHVKRVLKKADELSPTPLGAFETEGVYSGDWGVIENSVVLNAIKELGFDSMYVEEAGQKNLAVFDPGQIKSAIGNDGQFSPTTPSIREARVRNPQLDTPEFQRFFKDSKVVDESGQPLVVYHGTKRDIDVFRTFTQLRRKQIYAGDIGTWFASTPRATDYFSGVIRGTNEFGIDGVVYPAYLSINNPKEYGSYSEFLDDVGQHKSARSFRSAVEKQGFDGLVVRDSDTDAGGLRDDWVVFAPNQIKSAVGNIGTFDITRPSIREARLGPNVISLMNDQEQPPRKLRGKKQVAQYLQDRALDALGGRPRDLKSEADRDAIANDLVEEALYEMGVQKNALEWYDSTIERTIEMMALRHPEIKTDPNARTAFLVSLAVTSQNLAVPDNLKYSEEVYNYFKRNRRFPEKGFGSKAPSIKRNFEKANRLIDQLGSMEAFTDFLQTEFTVGELNPVLKKHLGKGAKVGGELVGANVYGSAVFGPKIGNGFYTNLRGDFSPVTIDMWFMRTIGRLTGRVMDFEEKKFAKQLNRLAEAAGTQGASTDDLIAKALELKKQHEKDYKQFKPEYQAGTRKKTEATNAAITIVKSLNATRDAPSTGTEREQLRDIVDRAINKMRNRTGQDISPAAFQALIWYPEQDLYKKLGVKLKHVRQDYANSTKEFLRRQGIDERELKRAEDRVRSRRQRGARRVRPGAIADVESAIEPAGGRVGAPLQGQERTPVVRESRVAPRPELQLNEAVTKAEESIAKTPKTAIPLYNLNASPDALYVAENPEDGERLDASDRLRYSRSNQPVYDPNVQEIIDRLAVTPPDETPGETIVNGLEMSPLRDMIDKFRQSYIFNYSRLERFNQRHPSLINNAADTNSLVAAEMADRNKAFTASAIKDGVPVYENGIVKIADFIHNGRQYRGLAEVMIPLYNNPYGNLEKLAQSYAIAIRGRRLQAEGKLAPGKTGDIEALEAAVNQYIDPNTNRPIIKDWYDAWQAYNAYIVQFLRDTGIIDDEGAQLWLDQSDYIPFYRETKAGPVAHPKIFGGLTSTTQLKAVGKSEEGIDMPLLNSILTNLDAAIAMGMKNVAQQRIVRDMIQIGLGRMVQPGQSTEGLMTVTFKVGGKKYSAIIDDPLIFESMQALPEMGISGMLETVFRVPANVLREMITREPGYMLANIMRDTAAVTMTSQASLGSTVTAVKDFSDGFENLRRLGVIGGYDFARDPDNMVEYLAKAAKEMGHEIPADYQTTLGRVARSPYFKPLTWAWDALGQLSDRAEALNRIRVYEDTLKRTGNEAEAVYQALSVINYGRRGRSPAIRALTAVVPFLNARIQGLDKLYQAGTGQFGPTRDRRRNALNFTVRAGLMVGLTALYYSMVSDEEEYKNANPEVVDNYYLLPTPMDFAIRIPIPFEVGILFKTIPERIMRLNNEVDTWRDARQSASRAFFGTLAFNPVPQAVLPIAEVIANYDSFTGRSVIPPYMDERMAAEYQARFGTNELARILGEATGFSPIKIDHLLNGYFGSLGTYTLNAIDHILRDADRAYPERKPYEYPFVRRFFADANQPGLQTQFYDLYREVGKVTNTVRQLREDGRVDELNAYLMENQNILAIKRNVDLLNKRMKAYRDQREKILKSELDPEVKREIIDQLNENINVTLQVMPILRRMAFMEQNQAGE